MGDNKGYISREYTVWCGTCGNWQRTGTCFNMKQAQQDFRQAGWKKTKEHGWVCPKCQAKK